MLRLALVNLISNAVKFTRTRPKAEIEIGCTEQKTDSGRGVRSGQWCRIRYEICK